MIPQRVQLSRRKGWEMPQNTVHAARPGPWGNPFIVGKHGTQARCVELYRNLMAGFICLGLGNCNEQQIARAHVEAHRHELRGKSLACWCRLGTPCHADVLLEIANPPKPEDK